MFFSASLSVLIIRAVISSRVRSLPVFLFLAVEMFLKRVSFLLMDLWRSSEATSFLAFALTDFSMPCSRRNDFSVEPRCLPMAVLAEFRFLETDFLVVIPAWYHKLSSNTTVAMPIARQGPLVVASRHGKENSCSEGAESCETHVDDYFFNAVS